jgi:hypothetical protein
VGLFLISCCRGACITPSFHGGEYTDGDGQVSRMVPYHTYDYQESRAAPLLFLSIQHMLYALKSNYFYAELLGIICSQNVI